MFKLSSFFCNNKKKLESHKSECKKRKKKIIIEFFYELKKILEFNQYIKSEIIPYTIYADIEYLVKKQITVKVI